MRGCQFSNTDGLRAATEEILKRLSKNGYSLQTPYNAELAIWQSRITNTQGESVATIGLKKSVPYILTFSFSPIPKLKQETDAIHKIISDTGNAYNGKWTTVLKR